VEVCHDREGELMGHAPKGAQIALRVVVVMSCGPS